MDRATILNHLAQAERHVNMGAQHVSSQLSLIERMQRDGHDVTAARQLLEQFEEIQALHIVDRDRLRAELDEFQNSIAPSR
jgi:Spy/CpxP family protein refolding chaperone